MTASLWVSLVFTLAIFGIVVVYPLFLRKDSQIKIEALVDGFNDELAALEKLKELESDYKMGKLSEDDYKQMELSIKRELLN